MITLTVELPERIGEQLNKRAQSEGKAPQAVAREILEHDLNGPAEKPETPSPPAATAELSVREREERAYQKMRDAGLSRTERHAESNDQRPTKSR
ncbi:MAG: hypothetical protein HY782_03995 [Chloroflexi bacterium]|nr:hypothetical protein [Chloroflexota bacterium]